MARRFEYPRGAQFQLARHRSGAAYRALAAVDAFLRTGVLRYGERVWSMGTEQHTWISHARGWSLLTGALAARLVQNDSISLLPDGKHLFLEEQPPKRFRVVAQQGLTMFAEPNDSPTAKPQSTQVR